MVPSSTLLLAVAAMIPMIAANTPPVCNPSNVVMPISTFHDTFTSYCEHPTRSTNSSGISLSYTKGNGTDCNQNDCQGAFTSMVSSCNSANKTITGTGSSNVGCGIYIYTILPTNGTNGSHPTTTSSSTLSHSATPSATSTSGHPAVTTHGDSTSNKHNSGARIPKVSGALLVALAGAFVVYM